MEFLFFFFYHFEIHELFFFSLGGISPYFSRDFSPFLLTCLKTDEAEEEEQEAEEAEEEEAEEEYEEAEMHYGQK